MQYYTVSLTQYQRLPTREVKIGDLLLGNFHPIRIQTMTTTDTMDTEATVAQCIRCIEAGAELVRITAPSIKEAENLLQIKKALRQRGYHTPLVADIHFTPNAAEVAARIVEKVRINPGNYVDKKKFQLKEYSDAEYQAEIERIRERFVPLIRICKEYGTAMRIGTNHGSLSDRIMSRYGDTPMGMVESAMEFLRIARDENYHQIVLSMKASNPQVMVQAYRLLVKTMMEEFGECYPLHLGVTEAGDGEDGRIKSAMGIGTLLEDGIGDTIRVSLTEEPEFEIPVCQDIVKRYADRASHKPIPPIERLAYSPFQYQRRTTQAIGRIGGKQVPVVVADFSEEPLTREKLADIGYRYDAVSDKWHVSDTAADFVYVGNRYIDFPLPGSLQVICDAPAYVHAPDPRRYVPLFTWTTWLQGIDTPSPYLNLIAVDTLNTTDAEWEALLNSLNDTTVLCIYSQNRHTMPAVRQKINDLMLRGVTVPVILCAESFQRNIDDQLIQFAIDTGALLLDGMGDGIWLKNHPDLVNHLKVSGRTYLEVHSHAQFLNNTAFSILQASRTRISKTEYISCPSCGRTLFDLQETTSRIRAATHHLKGVKIAVMGCIVNGPGEMADADFGYVGSGPGKITLYKGKEVVKRNIPAEIAVEALIDLIKENGMWVDPPRQPAASTPA
ncbi:MAG: (E)-4-hydroxy-3-methylbut-2-enyl-diphosphate synthase [Thermoflavifilum sp.]|nr:(E)-4-hydroxy-3-methylbut-2-enyl-diphosphate synthase [Thermoflavifilum sp.]